MRQPWVAVDTSVAQRRIFVTAESEHRLIHLFGVEHPELHEQVEIFDRQAGDCPEQIWFQFCDHILQRVLAEVGQIHEGRNPRGELDQLLLD